MTLRRGLLWTSTALMTMALVLRSVQLGTAPLLSPIEALYFYAWLVFVIYLSLMRSPTQASVGALLVPFGTLCSIMGAVSFTTDIDVNPIFQNPLFSVHVISAFLGYSALSIACCAGILYLLLHDQVTHKRIGGLFNRLPPLEDLDRLGHRTVVLGLVMLTIGMISGAVWARQEWGVNWILEPKVVWSLISWMIYTGYLVARRLVGWRGERAAWVATTGFAVSIFTFLGTNYLLATGRHVF